ncbi:hypothetical protein ZOD2009_07984 [Haladaptatus paucihalophilus DX253]|uniref:Flagellin N-terminal-like domain-containing protein n=1 Tax=Haladaptatus paucihalophilus DX253 TaxID=797209 RepID=E7QS24_HALPU|nr:type IV pilin N-terminal domain-containing protein [Haladaptatus paucihalophilus]EFW92793.1 hypothetical protein ZOD2009_07984 [Haladaptatus paucihalophilus DX253]SHK12448.1 flagellin N-terminal-like domain-containing protein [Haladaptatus paucihalophilus DX253]
MTLKETVSAKLSETRAVSPVIGVILMVAITVILAAVIGTFVMGLGNNVSKNAQAGVSFDQNATAVDIQLTSMGNVNDVSSFSLNATGSCSDISSASFNDVGDIVTTTGCSAGDKITVTASIDGEKNVIATYTSN